MLSHDVDKFLYKVCKHVRYKGAHTGIRVELQDHIQDRIYDFIDQGYGEETAIIKSVETMGDPAEIGKGLNKQHKPYIGWLLSAVNTFIVLVGLYITLTLVPDIFYVFRTFATMPDAKDVKYSVTLNQKDKIDDRTVEVKKLVIDNNGIVYIRYDDYINPFLRGWSLLDFEIYDDIGNRYTRTIQSTGNIFGRKHLIYIDRLNSGANKLILNYDYYNRKMRFELPLHGGNSI
jgi:hypothetical protein